MEKGTSNGTVTDIDGNFRLKTASGSTLVISYIGFATQEFSSMFSMTVARPWVWPTRPSTSAWPRLP